MNVLEEVNGSGQTLHANFEAFKFPTSSVVQFRALVTPCIPRYVCHRVTLWGQQINLNQPVQCTYTVQNFIDINGRT